MHETANRQSVTCFIAVETLSCQCS